MGSQIWLQVIVFFLYMEYNRAMQLKRPEMRESNLKELFDEFKFHLVYRNKQTRVTSPLSDEFKNLLAQLQEENRVKRAKIRGIQQSRLQKTSQELIRPSTSLQSRIWQPREICQSDLEGLRQNLLLVEREKESLRNEISNLESSLVELKKNVGSMRKKVQLEGAKVEKYKHISYLSHSIQRNTDSVKILNTRSFKSMLKYQEETLTNLKRFKTTLRKENEELENKFVQTPNNHCPTRKLMTQPSQQDQVTNIKIDRRFMSSLQELLQLFIQREEQFQEIKAQQTTKVRLKKVQKQYLKDDRIKWHDMIQKFQEKYEVKTESLANLIIYIYKRLTEESSEMENECIKRNEIKTLLIQDLQHLNQKGNMIIQKEKNNFQGQDHTSHPKRERIFKNSHVLLRLILMFHSLIGKFKYLFTMAITLSKEKKNFHQLLVQIGHMYNPNHILLDCSDEGAGNFQSAVASFKNIQDIMAQPQAANMEISKEQLLSFIFSDLRYTLIFRKADLEEELREGMERGNILEKVQGIQNRCEDIYSSKIKIYSMLLINCLKSLSMNKYQKKMVASSKAKQSIFMSIPKSIKIVNLEENSERNSVMDQDCKVLGAKYNSEESVMESTRFEFGEDPRKIVQTLQKLKNQQRQKFRPLNLNSDQVYMYGRKVVLPKYIL